MGVANPYIMAYPWKFYEKSVGMWVVESNRSVFSFPLSAKETDVKSVAREYFHYFDDIMVALRDLFAITAIEYPPGEILVESPIPLYMDQSKDRLIIAWEDDTKKCEAWSPGAIFSGLTEVVVETDSKVVKSQLPNALRLMFSGVPGSDRYALMLSTNCDIWLEETISGEDNSIIGAANSLRLRNALESVADALDGEVVHFATEFPGIKINEHGFGLK
jgi:hypothetical protein